MAVKVFFLSLVFYLGYLYAWPRMSPVTNQLGLKERKEANSSIETHLKGLILASNIKKYIPFINAFNFKLIIVFIFLITVYLAFKVTNVLFIAIAVGFMVSYLPKIFLDILIVINAKKVKKNYLSFLNVFYGFYSLNSDIIGAFRRSTEYLNEPLKSFINGIVFKYDKSLIDFSECLSELELSVKDKDFVKFVKFTKIHLYYGSDFKKTLEKLIEQAKRMEVVRAEFASSAVVGIFVILFMSVLNLAGLILAYTYNPDIAYFLRNTYLGHFLVIVDLITVAIGYYIAADFYKS